MKPQQVPPRIMVVDDDPDTVESICSLLSCTWPSATIEAHHDGRAALEAARQQVPDLLLTDLHMPDMDGLELLRHLAPVVGPSRVMLMTAAAGSRVRFRVFEELGAGHLLEKPLDPAMLLAQVEERLGGPVTQADHATGRRTRSQRPATSSTMRRYAA